MVISPLVRQKTLLETFPGYHPVQWRTASPLWLYLKAGNENSVFAQPAILRFTTDSFMEDFLAIASRSPERLWEWQVQKETWRQPAPNPPLDLPRGETAPLPPITGQPPENPALQEEVLKLYQPAHERYYLVTANLVCRLPSLPDKKLNNRNGDRVSFVVRRQMLDGNNLKEHAFVDGGWQPLDPAQTEQLTPSEKTFPMFPMTYTEPTVGATRRMFAGLIPVSQREALLNAERQSPSTVNPDPTVAIGDRREQLLTLLKVDVIAPWQNINRLREQEDSALPANQTALNNLITTILLEDLSLEEIQNLNAQEKKAKLSEKGFIDNIQSARDKLQTSSWYALLDFAYYLRDYLPTLWTRINASNPNASAPEGTAGKALLDLLQNTMFGRETSEDFTNYTILKNQFRGNTDATSKTSLAQVLKAVYAARDHLENATDTYSRGATGWLTTEFLLCADNVQDLVKNMGNIDDTNPLFIEVQAALTALPHDLTKQVPLVPSATAIAKNPDYANDTFTIRCVYERPNCPPTVHPTVVSQPTRAFQMASYFDPDAPARPIRIPMPIDTSPAGLRKFAKNTMFVMSDTLACQVEKARDLTFGDLVLSVLPWPFHKNFNTNAGGCQNGRLSFGKICTLSIPIITICALILLIIIVSLLDLIFKWVPYLIFCLPLPGLKAKEEE